MPQTRSWLSLMSTLAIAACGGGSAQHQQVDSAATPSSSEQAVAAGEAPVDVSATAADSRGWYFCANEGERCTFSGTRRVRYGADGRYAYQSATGAITCSTEVFGDPAPGAAKRCDIASTPSPYGQDAAMYTLTFRDEFNGTALDTRLWNDHIWFQSSSDAPDYGVSNGQLRIWPEAASDGTFKSRILTTHQKFAQTYGYFEMEAKLPVGKGLWPAFWLLNSDSPPGEPEIDVMEAYPGGEVGTWADENQHPIAFESSFYQDGNGQPTGLTGQMPFATGDLSSAFHKYAVQWEPNRLSYYFDGKLLYSAEVAMSRKMYILVNLQYGGASGDVDGTTPLGPDNAFQVNYVRAWQLGSPDR